MSGFTLSFFDSIDLTIDVVWGIMDSNTKINFAMSIALLTTKETDMIPKMISDVLLHDEILQAVDQARIYNSSDTTLTEWVISNV